MDTPKDRTDKIIAALAELNAIMAAHPTVPMVAALYEDLLPGYVIPEMLRDIVRHSLAIIAAILPNDQILILNIAEAITSTLDKIIVLSAAIRKMASDTVWLHYNLAFNLDMLADSGMVEAGVPRLLHCVLVLQLAEPNSPAVPYMRKVLARHALPFAPREAILNAGIALRRGQADAMAVVRAGALGLGLIKPETEINRQISVLRTIEKACGFPNTSRFETVSTAFANVKFKRIFEKSSTKLPAPHGDDFYHMFREADRPIHLPQISVFLLEGGTVSFDLTQPGRTQFYIFDHNGACVEDLSWGAEPFIVEDVEQVKGDLGVIGDRFCGPMNVCHFLLDHLTRVAIYDKFLDKKPKILLSEMHEQYRRIMERANLVERTVFVSKTKFSIRAEQLLVSSNIISDFRHPAHLVAPWAIGFVQQRLTTSNSMKVDTPRRKLFISRADAKSRQIVNSDEVEAILVAHDFEIINLSLLSLDEQIAAFAEAECVAAVHGAGLTNIVFSRPGLKVLEILPPLVATPAYWILCHGAGHHYYAMIADDLEMARPDYTTWGHHPEYNDRNITVDPIRLTQMLDRLLEPLHQFNNLP